MQYAGGAHDRDAGGGRSGDAYDPATHQTRAGWSRCGSTTLPTWWMYRAQTFELGTLHGSRLPPGPRRESRLEAVIMTTYQRHHLEWIDSNGGPLILLSHELLTAWSGYDPQESEDDVRPLQ